MAALWDHSLFLAQLSISVGVMIFCCAMIATHKDSEATYLPVLCSIVGYWLPAPRLNNQGPAASKQPELLPVYVNPADAPC
jgi:hypothetical protein